MSKTAIVTDTNSGMSVEEGKNLGIYVLPMPVIIEQETFTEGESISHQELYNAIRQRKNISTSQPSPADVCSLWEKVLNDGNDELVYIPMSSGLSGSCEAAQGLSRSYDGKVFVADNHRISITQYQAALDARKMADQGMSAQRIKDYLEETAMDASIYIMVDSLEYLKKSGRVTAAAAAFAAVLNLKPVLTIQGDKLDAFSKARGLKLGEKTMIEAIRHDRETRFKDIPDEQLMVATAGTFDDPEHAKEWLNTVQAAFPEFKVCYVPLSCSIACHVGINAAGTGIYRIFN